MAKFVRVIALPKQGFYRAGLFWPASETTLPIGKFSKEQLEALEKEPRLKFSIVEIADKKAAGGGGNAGNGAVNGDGAGNGKAGGSGQDGPGASGKAPGKELLREELILAAVKAAAVDNKKPAAKAVEEKMQTMVAKDAPKQEITKAELNTAWERLTKK